MRAKTELVAVVRRMGRIRSMMRYKIRRKNPKLAACLLGHIDLSIWTSLVAQTVNRVSTMQETQVLFLGWEDPLEKEMAIHSRTIAWKIPWTEEPNRLQSMGSQKVGHDWTTSLYFTISHRSIKVKETKKAKMAFLTFKIYQNMSTILKSIQNVSPNKHQSPFASWHILAWPSTSTTLTC